LAFAAFVYPAFGHELSLARRGAFERWLWCGTLHTGAGRTTRVVNALLTNENTTDNRGTVGHCTVRAGGADEEKCGGGEQPCEKQEHCQVVSCQFCQLSVVSKIKNAPTSKTWN